MKLAMKGNESSLKLSAISIRYYEDTVEEIESLITTINKFSTLAEPEIADQMHLRQPNVIFFYGK